MIARALLFLLSLTLAADAIVDTNENGLSDLWEKQFNSGELFSNMVLQADLDGDGWSNQQESTAGTDPFNANSPEGFILPEVEYHSAVYGSPEEEGGPPLLETPETISIQWPSVAGKKYSVLASPDLAAESWLQLGQSRIGSGSTITANIPLTQPDGSIPDELFVRLAVEDTDTDEDTLTDAEEEELGSSPYSSDGDNDGLSDLAELFVHLTSPNLPDSDGDGVSDGTEIDDGTDPNSYASHGPVFKSVNRQLTSDIYVYDDTAGFLWYNVSWENPGETFDTIATRIAFPDLANTLAEGAPFPEEIPEVTEPWLYSNGWAITEPSGSYGSPPPKGRSVASLRQRRLWLQVAPAATDAIHRKFLKATTRPGQSAPLALVVESIDVNIPAGDTESAPLDLLGGFIGDGLQGYYSNEDFSQELLLVEVEAVFERDQVANRIPNPKRPDYYAISSSENSEKLKSKYYNRLFVSTEPETGQVEITVKHPVFPPAIAQLLSVDITDDTGQVIASIQMDESGETEIEFLPLEAAANKIYYVDISFHAGASQTSELMLESYAKNDGFSIQIITTENIQIQKNYLSIFIAPISTTVAGSFYTTFAGTTPSPADSTSLTPKLREIHEEPPTLIAGSAYNQSNKTTEIPSFQLPEGSGASNIAETYFSRQAGLGLHEICRDLMEKNHVQIWSDLTSGDISSKNYIFSIPADTRISFYYPGVVPPKYIWGGATYKSGSVTLKLKKVGNKIEATGIDMQAVIEDYYDFDYTRAIGTFSNRAATIQIGRETPPRSAGKIFHTLTDVYFSYNESTGDLINEGVTNGGPPIPFFNANGYIQDGSFATTGGAGGSGNE